MHRLFLKSVVSAAALLAITPALHAATNLLTNGDFEQDTRDSESAIGQINGTPDGWFTNTFGGVLNVSGVSSTGTVNPNFNPGYYSPDSAAVNGNYEGFTQGIGDYINNTGGTFAANTTYTLSFLVGNSYEVQTDDDGNPSATFAIALVDQQTFATLATSGAVTAPAPQQRKTVTISFTTGDVGTAGVGDGIYADFESFTEGSGSTLAFDNAVLTASPVPEPVSVAGIGLVAGGLLRRRRAR